MLAAAAAAVVAVFFLARPQRTDPFSQAARDWKSWKSGTLHLEIRSENPAALSRFFSERGIGFPVAAASLKIPGYRLIGARVHSLAGRPSAFSVYRGRDGEILVCQMYEGPLGVLPAGSRVVESGGVRVHAFERSNLSVVLWQDGPIVCALVSDGAFEDVVRLALARARERSGA
jgi:anti-sigma factor RsiW